MPKPISYENPTTIDKLRVIYDGLRYRYYLLREKLFSKVYYVVFKSPLEMRMPPIKRINIDLNFRVCEPENFDDLRKLAPSWKIKIFEKRAKEGLLAFIGYAGKDPVSYCWFVENSGTLEDFDYDLLPGEVYAFDAWVSPAYRGKGIAYYNFKFIYEFFKMRGFDTYMAIVEVTNKVMLKMYKKVNIEFYGILKQTHTFGKRRTYLLPPGEEENRIAEKYLKGTGIKLPERNFKFWLINNEKKLITLKSDWEKLYQLKGENNQSLSYEYYKKRWDESNIQNDLFVVACYEHRRIRSIFPFVLHKRKLSPIGFFKEICFIDSSPFQHTDFLLDGDRIKLIRAMLDLLRGPLSSKWDILNLRHLNESDDVFKDLVVASRERAYKYKEFHHYLDSSGMDSKAIPKGNDKQKLVSLLIFNDTVKAKRLQFAISHLKFKMRETD